MSQELVGLQARLSADSTGFKVGLDSARRDLAGFSATVRTEARNVKSAFDGIKNALNAVPGVAFAAALANSFRTIVVEAAEFERAMGAVKAVTQGSGIEMGRAEAAIRKTGLSFNIGARNAAGAAQELLKAGVSLGDLSDGALDAAVVMAQATGGTYADGAIIAAKATQVFRLEAEEMATVVQGAAGVINATAFDLVDYNQALQQGGAAARNAGVDLGDFNAVLALTASALGSSGSDTGTSFRTFISRLVPQSREAREEMERLGLSFYDAQGRFVGMEQVADRLKHALAGLSDEQRNSALITMFGVDAQRQAIALMDAGAEGVRRYRDEIIPAADANLMAKARTEGLMGAIDNLRSSFEELGIAIGQVGLTKFLTEVANAAGGGIKTTARFIDTFGDLDDPALQGLADQGRRIYRQKNNRGKVMNDDEAVKYATAQMSDQDILNFLHVTPFPNKPLLAWTAKDQLDFFNGETPRTRSGTLEDSPRGREIVEFLNERQPKPPTLWKPRVPQIVNPRSPGLVGAGEGSGDPIDLKDIDLTRIADSEKLLPKELSDPLYWELPIYIDPQLEVQGNVYDIALDVAANVHDDIRSAFIDGTDWNFDTIGETLNQAWRAMLWDALIGDSVQQLLKGATSSIADFLNASLNGSKDGGLIANLGNSFVKFAGFFEDGGYIPPNQWGIAGEAGPERIYGGAGGASVIPHGADGKAAGDVHINVYANDAVLASQLRSEVAQAVAIGSARARQGAVSDVMEMSSRRF